MEIFKEYNIRKILYPAPTGRVHINFSLPALTDESAIDAGRFADAVGKAKPPEKSGNKRRKHNSAEKPDSESDSVNKSELNNDFTKPYSAAGLLDFEKPPEARICEYYYALASRLASGLQSGESAVMGYRITFAGKKFVSFFWECMIYRDRTLTVMHPFSNTWDLENGYLLPLEYFAKHPEKITALCPGADADNFYLTDSGLNIYSCTFREGDGAGLRRSAYRNFLHEFEILHSQLKRIAE